MNTDAIEKILRERFKWKHYPLQIIRVEKEKEEKKKNDTKTTSNT
jgi:hypothetical protein